MTALVPVLAVVLVVAFVVLAVRFGHTMVAEGVAADCTFAAAANRPVEAECTIVEVGCMSVDCTLV